MLADHLKKLQWNFFNAQIPLTCLLILATLVSNRFGNFAVFNKLLQVIGQPIKEVGDTFYFFQMKVYDIYKPKFVNPDY